MENKRRKPVKPQQKRIQINEGTERKGGVNRRPAKPKPSIKPPPQGSKPSSKTTAKTGKK